MAAMCNFGACLSMCNGYGSSMSKWPPREIFGSTSPHVRVVGPTVYVMVTRNGGPRDYKQAKMLMRLWFESRTSRSKATNENMGIG